MPSTLNALLKAMTLREKLVTTRLLEFGLMLSGYFLYSIRWGGENQQILMSLGWLQILTAIYAFLRYSAPTRGITALMILFGFMGVAQIFYPFAIRNANIPGESSQYIEAAVRLYVYLFFVCLHALTVRREDAPLFLDTFLKLSRLSIMIAVGCMILYWTTGIPFLLNFYFSQGIIRPQAFLSEPSAFAPLVGCLLISGWLNKSRKDVAIALAGIAFALSPITILGGIGAFVLYAFLYKTRGALVKGAVIMSCFIALVFVNMMDCTSLVVSDSAIDRTLGRVSCGVQVIYDGNLRYALEGIFYNDRLESAIKSVEFLRDTKSVATGMGLNSSSIFMPELYGEVRENSLWLSILLFYGVFGVAVFALMCLIGMARMARATDTIAVIFVAFLVCSTINSAGGFYGYSILLWCITFALSPACRRRRYVLAPNDDRQPDVETASTT